MDKLIYQSCGSVIKIPKIEKRQSTDGTNVYCKIRREKYFELCWFFKTIPFNYVFSWIESRNWERNFLSTQDQEPLNGEINILLN